MKSKPLSNLLRFLESRNQHDKIARLIATQHHHSIHKIHVMVKAFLAIGALIASGFLITFLSVVLEDIFDIRLKEIAFISGVVLILIALVGERTRKDNQALSDFFIRMVCLMFMLAGKGLAIVGFVEWLDGFVDMIEGDKHSFALKMTCAIFIVTLLTYFIYDVFIDRLLGIFCFGIALLMTLFDRYHSMDIWMMVHGLFFVCTIAAFLFFSLYTRLQALFKPIVYALMGVLMFDVICLPMFFSLSERAQLSLNPFNQEILLKVSIGIGLMVLIQCVIKRYQTVTSIELSAHKIRWLAMSFVMLISLLTTPLVSFSLLCLCLGFALFEPIVLIGAMITLPYGLIRFYYDLHISLLDKSFVLMASGILLLIAFAYIKKQAWNQHD